MSVSVYSEMVKKSANNLSVHNGPVAFQVMKEGEVLISADEIAQCELPILTVSQLKDYIQKVKFVAVD